jgi:protein-S-isoprenylcysteine O-methyltransferase Ste14
MMSDAMPAYGLWSLVVLNTAVFILFAFSFFKPQTPRDWRTLGSFSAFVTALFIEMYGFPLTLYLLAPWLQSRFPGVELMTHDAGHLWQTLFAIGGNPHFGWLHLLSSVLIGGGFWLLADAWHVLYRAQRERRLATTGVYGRIRHPQYVAFVVVMFGFLLQWPTILTLAMFPILTVMYARLALTEERDARALFGAEWDDYAARTPRFVPRLVGTRPRSATPV